MSEAQAIWVPNIEDASCISINHKYRLIAVGRKNSQVCVFTIEDFTGGLELLYTNTLSKNFPSVPGSVLCIKWTPDGSACIVTWDKSGGFSLWSTFGSLLTCSFGWDYGFVPNSYFNIISLDWSCEGYQLVLIRSINDKETTELLQFDFIKSALSVNPCVSLNPFILIQGDDKIFINHNGTLETVYSNNSINDSISTENREEDFEMKTIESTSFLSAAKHWITVLLPTAYTNVNWPLRFSALDKNGCNLGVAGKSGIALYSLTQRKWKLFGNETQEKDFVVTGGLVWWNEYIIMGNYSLLGLKDEIRLYSREKKLDNKFAKIYEIGTPIMLINVCLNQLIIFTADSCITIFSIVIHSCPVENQVELLRIQIYDIKNICLHPAFVTSIFLTNLRHDSISKSQLNPEPADTIVLNVAGRVLMIQKENSSGASELMTTCLASCVECIWFFVDFPSLTNKLHLKESLWLYCGSHGMRVWLPVFPRQDISHRSQKHSFMAKRIMLGFDLQIYPLAISFDDAIIFGVEHDTVLHFSDCTYHFALPFSTPKQTSQVYLHHILKQLIKRNLGYNAWDIARSCSFLPYFPHSLELLLHEVLEQEATSKDPIPDPLLPSVIEFIQEFPVYLQTIVQCARKTEIALWPYLFAAAGKPRDLFQQCMLTNQLYTATNYLIILQNLEPSTISQQYASRLLDAALEQNDLYLSHDLVRFLKAIDPNDTDSPRNSFLFSGKLSNNQISPPVQPDAEDLSLILSHMTPRTSHSSSLTGMNKSLKKNLKRFENGKVLMQLEENVCYSSTSLEINSKLVNKNVDEQSTDSIISKHFKRHLEQLDLLSLGYISAAMDVQLVAWLCTENEKDDIPQIIDFVEALQKLHRTLDWPKPLLCFKVQNIDKVNASDSPSLAALHSYKESNDSGFGSAFPQRIQQKDINIRKKEPISIMPGFTSSWNESIEPHIQSINFFPFAQKTTKNLEVHLRYLLQFFSEANCLEYSLLLSVLLLDKTSINRVCNAAIRSSSLLCINHLKNGLQDLTEWSFNVSNGYKSFMESCDEDLKMLQNFLDQQETIPNHVQHVNLIRKGSSAIESSGDNCMYYKTGNAFQDSLQSCYNNDHLVSNRLDMHTENKPIDLNLEKSSCKIM